MYRCLFLFLFISSLSCNPDATPKTKPMTQPVTNIDPTADQQARRARSEAVCAAHGVPVYANPHSLFVDPEASVTLRTQDEVVNRALALLYIGLKSEGLEQHNLDRFAQAFGVLPNLSPEEKAYAAAQPPTEQQTIDANWRYEGLYVLLWALGYVDSLHYPDRTCDVATDAQIVFSRKEAGFRQHARLRSKAELLDAADLILRLDWACVNARLKNQPPPGGLDKSVVVERHHALNWLIRYLNQDWDDVRTDT